MKVLFRSLIVVVVLSITGIISYKAAMMYFQPKQEDTAVTEQVKDTSDKTVASVEGVSKNLIYCYDKDAKEITKIVLEILDSNDKKLNYVTIPVRTQLTLSNALHNKLMLDDPEIPQVLKLSTLTKYLSSKNAFQDEVKIVEELLGTDINYYTAIPVKTYDTIFREKNIKQKDGYDAVPEEVFTNTYRVYIQSLNSKEKLSNYLEEIYPKLTSDLPLNQKKDLLDSYSEIEMKDIKFALIQGMNLNNGYVIDEDSVSSQLAEYITNTAD